MSQTDRLIEFPALGIVMLYNELWNIVLFRWQNPFAGFLGVLAFLAPLLLLQVILLLVEPISGKPRHDLLDIYLSYPLD